MAEEIILFPGPLYSKSSVDRPSGLDYNLRIAIERFRVIEPILKFDRQWPRPGGMSRRRRIRVAARHYGVSQRTVYQWLDAFYRGGITRLMKQERKDKGKPKVLNEAALSFLRDVAKFDQDRGCKATYGDLYRAYNEEREWRAAHVGKPLGAFEHHKHSHFVDPRGCLSPDAQLPEVKERTLFFWFRKAKEMTTRAA